ncbi:MAG: HDOD domain-containing protein [bacterium]|jgi:putative nucleotidyltransferase with HDIG domain
MTSGIVSIKDFVSKTQDLPTMPEAALRVVRLANDEDIPNLTIARALANDQGLAARILRLANSAYYGLPHEVSTLNDAVMLLGTRTIRHMALLASTFPWLAKELSGYDLAPAMLWRHSFTVAIGAEIIAKQTRSVSPDEAFTAGLLHDIGKVVMSMWMKDMLPEMLKKVREENIPFNDSEYNSFGFTHADVGGHLASQWNLPESLVKAVTNHHCPDRVDSTSSLTQITHIADAVALSIGIGIGGDGLHYPFSSSAMEHLGLSESDLEFVADKMVDTIAKSKPLFEFN